MVICIVNKQLTHTKLQKHNFMITSTAFAELKHNESSSDWRFITPMAVQSKKNSDFQGKQEIEQTAEQYDCDNTFSLCGQDNSFESNIKYWEVPIVHNVQM